jgi:hypothetical protein
LLDYTETMKSIPPWTPRGFTESYVIEVQPRKRKRKSEIPLMVIALVGTLIAISTVNQVSKNILSKKKKKKGKLKF